MQVSTVATADASGASAGPQPRLVRAAHEFEAQMMKELMKPLHGGSGLTGTDDTDEDSGAGGALGEFASEALGKALSAGGGFGIAHQIIKALSHTGNQPGVGPVTTNQHVDTVIRGIK